MKQGIETGKFGEWLVLELKHHIHTQKLQVKYDHGNRVYYDQGVRLENQNVCAIKGFYRKDKSDKVTNLNRLADVDILIADEKDDIIAIIEIEEGKSSPKKILGDVFAILLCNSFSINNNNKDPEYFKITKETILLIYGVMPGKGKRIKKVEETIEPGIKEFTPPTGSILTKKVELKFCEDIQTTIKELKARINKELNIKLNCNP